MRSTSYPADDASPNGAGYASAEYARSLEEFGDIRALPRCGGWLLKNAIAGTDLFDGMGCYPFFCCDEWSALGSDLEALTERLVSVRLVTDPFAEVNVAQLNNVFRDTCYEYKQHFVTDLSQPLERIVASNHRRNVRKALHAIEVRPVTPNVDALATWQHLYSNLTRRHSIDGIAQFSPMSFERQMQVPGFTAFSAYADDETCGMTQWYVQGEVAYYHLAAYSDRGYELSASFALFWQALTYFAERGVRWASLGAGAGVNAAESGLTRFKRGWATHTRPVYFCGRVLQPAAYAKLSATRPPSTSFFPAYRAA